ncbi:transporter substrate-binding domain-containing protein [Pseudorhodoplanes sp.]|uniref:transporter substrate-binding domain-containing protein n=1 Tax=Pseudorhodoplanes sp. TaxID=1934341 RepID=UPI003D0D816B
MKIKHLWLYVVAAFLCLVTAAYAQESRLDAVVKRGKLIVATYSTAPPLAFTDENGKLVGFEVEIARLIAKDLLGDPNKIEFIIIQSEGRFPSVLSGRADFAIAATTIYPERAAKVAFTHPYMDSGSAVLVRRDSGVKSLADLNDEKFTITGQNNPQNAERAKRFVPKAKTLWFDNPSELLLAVKSGRATAMQTDVPIADYFALQNKDLVVLPDMVEKLGVANNAIFMKPGDFTWWLFLDTVVRELRYGSRYHEYTDMYQKWFGKNPPPQRFYIGHGK